MCPSIVKAGLVSLLALSFVACGEKPKSQAPVAVPPENASSQQPKQAQAATTAPGSPAQGSQSAAKSGSSKSYSKTLKFSTSASRLERLDLLMPDDGVTIEPHDGKKLKVEFKLVSDSKESLDAITNSSLTKSKKGKTQTLDLSYDGGCFHYHYEGGEVKAVSGTCLHEATVWMPRTSYIDVFETKKDETFGDRTEQVWRGETTKALEDMNQAFEELNDELEKDL